MTEKAGLSVKKSEDKEKGSVSLSSKTDLSQSMEINSPVQQVLHLQRTIGNQAVTRLIQSGVLQAKLSIGQPGDIYEQEAERVAELVMQMPASETTRGKHLPDRQLPPGLQQVKIRGKGITQRIQRIPANPTGVPFDGEIIPWSAALRSTPHKDPDHPHRNTIADLPRGHRVRVLGGRAWIFVKTYINGRDRVGYVSHELIRQVAGAASPTFTTDVGNPISVSGPQSVPPLAYEQRWMEDQGLADRVRRIPNTASGSYNCHGFVYLNAMAWLNDPTSIIQDNDYYVPTNPRIGDAVVYTTSTLSLNDERRPIITSVPPHSGLVTRGSEGNPTEVTSKWGSWHIYKHRPTDVWSEYGQPTYLRSDRAGGHTVRTT